MSDPGGSIVNMAIVGHMGDRIRKESKAREKSWAIVQEEAMSEAELLTELEREALSESDSRVPGNRSDDPRDCLVCGYQFYYPDQPWSPNGETPTGESCPCCGCVFGVDDAELGKARKYRYDWLVAGAEWKDASSKPDSWNIHVLARQMRNLPERAR